MKRHEADQKAELHAQAAEDLLRHPLSAHVVAQAQVHATLAVAFSQMGQGRS